MKRMLTLLIALLLIAGASTALASNMDVVIIPSEDVDVETSSLDDMKMDIDVSILNYCVIKPTKFAYADTISKYGSGSKTWVSTTYESGHEAQYACLYVNIKNITQKSTDFLKECTVTVTYADQYVYSGWSHQFDWDNSEGADKAKTAFIDKDDLYAIKQMYVGHYVFGCTLPNAVVNGEGSLRMDISIGKYEMTYYIRK